jgi:hypothetical protein
MTDVALPGSIEPAKRKGPNLSMAAFTRRPVSFLWASSARREFIGRAMALVNA